MAIVSNFGVASDQTSLTQRQHDLNDAVAELRHGDNARETFWPHRWGRGWSRFIAPMYLGRSLFRRR